MKILGIETSCDETALCVIDAHGHIDHAEVHILGTALISQIDIHKEYGGVFPALAKREHSRNLIPLLEKILNTSRLSVLSEQTALQPEVQDKIKELLAREPEMLQGFLSFIPTIEKPALDALAVTVGPGLEPALWVGINFAKALSLVWNIPVIPINHMEGHVVGSLLQKDTAELLPLNFPCLALLISGGHTELVLMKEWNDYTLLGETRDDAVGEAFDKAARMLGLPYPGGPEISRLAEKARTEKDLSVPIILPRPMLKSDDLDFSFSGLKTAVLYAVKKLPELTDNLRQSIALEFENAITEVLVYKTKKALTEYGARTLIVGGGVSANTHIQQAFADLKAEFPDTTVYFPQKEISTDNALMIALAGYLKTLSSKEPYSKEFKASGSLTLDKNM